MLNEIGVIEHGNNTYCNANKSCDEIIDESPEYTKRLGFKITEKKEKNTTDHILDLLSLHLNYPLQNKFQNLLPMCLSLYTTKLKFFYKNAKFLSNYNKFWVLQNSDPIIQSLNNINKKSVPNLLQHMTFRNNTQSYHNDN